MNMPDNPIVHEQAMLEVAVGLRYPVEFILDEFPVVRMRASEHELERRRHGVVDAQTLEGFFRPDEASGGGIPAKTASAAELLRDFQIGLVSAQEVKRQFVVLDVICSAI